MVNGQGVAWNEQKARAYGRGASALAPGVGKGLKLYRGLAEVATAFRRRTLLARSPGVL